MERNQPANGGQYDQKSDVDNDCRGVAIFASLEHGAAMPHPLRTIIAALAGVVALANTVGQAPAQSAGTDTTPVRPGASFGNWGLSR